MVAVGLGLGPSSLNRVSQQQRQAAQPTSGGVLAPRPPVTSHPQADVYDGGGGVRPWQHLWRAGLAWLLGAVLFLTEFSSSPASLQPNGVYPIQVDALLGLDLLLGQVAVLAVFLRRRWPVSVAVLTMALCALSVFAAPAAFLAVGSLAIRRKIAPLIPVAGISVIAALVYALVVTPWLDPQLARTMGSWFLWTSVAISLVAFSVCALIGWNLGSRRALVDSWRVQAATVHREQTARVAQAQLAERARIAREMHDVLAHRLSVVAMHAGGLAYRDDLTREEVATTAETIRVSAHTALEELREVLGVLRAEDVNEATKEGSSHGAPPGGSTASHPQPELCDIPALVAEAETHGNRVRLETPPQLWPQSVSLPTSTGRHAYRVVQEALTNARKHAPGEIATVRLDGDPDIGLSVRVTNPMPQRPPTTPGSQLGLTGMAERVNLAGGHLEVGQRGDQFVVDVWLPWQRTTKAPRNWPTPQKATKMTALRQEQS